MCFSLSLNSQISRPHSPDDHDDDHFEGYDDVDGDHHDDHFEGHDDVNGDHDGHDDGDDGGNFV